MREYGRVATSFFNIGETCNIRRTYQKNEGNPGIPVLIRFASSSEMSADVTLFPGEPHEQMIGSFKLDGWERVDTTLDKLRKAEPGSFVVVGRSDLKLVKIGEDSWVVVGHQRKNTPSIYRDIVLSQESKIEFLDN